MFLILLFYWLKKGATNTVFSYINVNVGDQLGGNVHTALLSSAGRKIRITVPTAADWVGISSSWGGMLDTGGGYYTNRFT